MNKKTMNKKQSDMKVLMRYLYRREWKEKWVTLADVAKWTREGKYQHRVNAARGLEAVQTETGMASGRGVAEELPMIFPAQGEEGYTGLVLLSFRTDKGVETLEQLRQTVNNLSQVLMSFVGSSGQSLKVIIPYKLTGGTLPENDEQERLFKQYAFHRAAGYLQQATGMAAEEVEHDGSEAFRISYDAKAYLNEAVTPIEMSQPTEPLTDKTAQVVSTPEEVALDTEVLPGYTRREMDAMKFNAICRQLAYEEVSLMDEHLMHLAVACRKAGIDQELATKLTLEALDCYNKETLVRSTFNTAYEKHPLGKAQPLERALMHQLLLDNFLHRRYQFRRNKVTGDVEYQEKNQYAFSWRPLTEAARNDINNAAIREGIKVWPRDLERTIVSERTEDYDPVGEWLQSLPSWDGKDRLGEMADRVKTNAPGWRDNFKIWMRQMVSQWMSGVNALYGAQMVLMLVGAQGTRKSTFMRLLLPREFMPYYIDRIDFTNKKEALRALSRFLLINIDEYDQVSKTQMAFLKHLIQRTDVKERKLYTTTFEQQQRYAAFCATTNALQPLKDDSGSRRYLVVEVTAPIDTDTEGDKRIDYRQLYAQIMQEIKRGEEYAFTGEREQQIQKQNGDYYDTPNIIALFEDLYRQPQAGDEVLLMSPTELLSSIKDQRHVNVITQSNATVLGNYLHRRGYKKGKGRQYRCYQVTRTNVTPL